MEGHDKVKQTYQKSADKLVCYNNQNPEKPPAPYAWVDKNVTCRDWKIRYCCDRLWGEAVASTAIKSTDVIVDRPNKKTLFEGCNWLNFMSVSDGRGQGDFESRARNFKFFKKSTCKMDRFAALYIDTRRIKDDVPWDETGEFITKNSPM